MNIIVIEILHPLSANAWVTFECTDGIEMEDTLHLKTSNLFTDNFDGFSQLIYCGTLTFILQPKKIIHYPIDVCLWDTMRSICFTVFDGIIFSDFFTGRVSRHVKLWLRPRTLRFLSSRIFGD